MRLHVTLLAVAVSCLLAQTTWAAADNFEDNDFAEFEDFDDDEFVVGNAAGGAANQQQQQQQQQQEGTSCFANPL